jgi:hypothetical protein
MNWKLVVIAVVCLLGLAAAQVPWGGESERSRAQVYALEGLGALGGVACAAGCGGAALGVALIGAWGSMDSPAPTSAVTMVGACLAYVCAAALPAASGYGVAKAGEGLGEDGAQVWATVGAYIGAPIALGALAFGGNIAADGYGRRAYWSVPVYVLGVLAIPAGAVVGYNLGAPSRSHIGSRLQLPAMALTSTRPPDRQVEYGVRVQLAGLRF